MGVNKRKLTKLKKKFENIYYDPEGSGGLSGKSIFLRNFPKNQRKIAAEWLLDQDAYILHTAPKRKFPRRQIIAPFQSQMQIDLIDLPSLKSSNDGYRYILTAIDAFSRKAWVRPLKTKTASEVTNAFRSILDEIDFTPFKIFSDQGTEFSNHSFRNLLKDRKIQHFTSTDSGHKCAHIERYNQSILKRLFRYLTKKNTQRYIDVLDYINKGYNKTYHSTLGTAPNQVNHTNKERIWRRIYRLKKNKPSLPPKFKVEDFVRVSTNKRSFKKSYISSWSGEIFKIKKVLNTTPITYTLVDLLNEEISGSFYTEELLKTKYPSVFAIEKILDQNKDKILVRWKHYPKKFDSWIHAGNIQNI